jgi:hypothetical protein
MDSKDLIEKIQEEFSRRFKEKEDFSDYKQVQNYAVEIAEKSAKAVINNFDESLINEFGTLDYDILNEVLSRILESDYKLIADACIIAQTEMNKNANIGLKAIAPKYDDDRAHSIVWDMAQRNLESFKQAYPAYTDNFYQSTVDEAVRANADFQWEARLEPKIVRIAEPTACKWCKSIEGTYKYEDVKDTGNDVFRRHTDCKCTVTYVPGKGKAKDVWSKREVSDKEVTENLKKLETNLLEKTNRKDMFESELIGQEVNDVKIEGVSYHTIFERSVERNISVSEISDAINNPLEIGDIKTDKRTGNRSFKIVGEYATIYMNPDTGNITTCHKTHSGVLKKLKKK